MLGAALNVPASTFTFEPLLIDRLLPFVNVPLCKFSVVPEANEVPTLNVTPLPELLIVNALKVVAADPPMVWPKDPLKVTVPASALKFEVPALLTQLPAVVIP